MLEHAEVLVVQVPHTSKTEKMIGAPELDLLGKGSILVNCCDGRSVRTLFQRRTAGAMD